MYMYLNNLNKYIYYYVIFIFNLVEYKLISGIFIILIFYRCVVLELFFISRVPDWLVIFFD